MAVYANQARIRPLTDAVAGARPVDADDLGRPDAVGWHRDPADAAKQRFWDGRTWSMPVTAGTVATEDSVPRRFEV